MNRKTKTYIKTELLTTEELSAYIGVPVRTILRRAKSGVFDSVKKGKNVLLFSKGDFDPKT